MQTHVCTCHCLNRYDSYTSDTLENISRVQTHRDFNPRPPVAVCGPTKIVRGDYEKAPRCQHCSHCRSRLSFDKLTSSPSEDVHNWYGFFSITSLVSEALLHTVIEYVNIDKKHNFDYSLSPDIRGQKPSTLFECYLILGCNYMNVCI